MKDIEFRNPETKREKNGLTITSDSPVKTYNGINTIAVIMPNRDEHLKEINKIKRAVSRNRIIASVTAVMLLIIIEIMILWTADPQDTRSGIIGMMCIMIAGSAAAYACGRTIGQGKVIDEITRKQLVKNGAFTHLTDKVMENVDYYKECIENEIKFMDGWTGTTQISEIKLDGRRNRLYINAETTDKNGDITARCLICPKLECVWNTRLRDKVVIDLYQMTVRCPKEWTGTSTTQ